MLAADQINDVEVTRKKGQSGSVMDYNPINIAPKGQKQGDYVTTTIGPYDYWAIEYAYKHVDGNEADELKKIAARSPDPDLVVRHRRGHVPRQRPAGEHLRPRLGRALVRQGPDRPGVAADEGPRRQGGPRRRGVVAAPLRLLGAPGPVGQRRLPGGRPRRRPAGLARPQGGQGVPRPARARPGGQAARRPEVRPGADPQRPVVQVLAGPAPPHRQRAVVSLGQRVPVLLRRGRRVPGQRAHPGASRRSSWASASPPTSCTGSRTRSSRPTPGPSRCGCPRSSGP